MASSVRVVEAFRTVIGHGIILETMSHKEEIQMRALSSLSMQELMMQRGQSFAGLLRMTIGHRPD
jgi:hypothetical protein